MEDESTSETEATVDKEKPAPSGDDQTPFPNSDTRTPPSDKSFPEPIESPITDRLAIENYPDDPEPLENPEIDPDDPEPLENPEIGYGDGDDHTPFPNTTEISVSEQTNWWWHPEITPPLHKGYHEDKNKR